MVLFPSIFGPSGSLSAFFLNPQNLLFALAFLVPLVILYLIRPRPVNVAVPSLMFILSDMGKSNIHRFFRTLFRDVLFIIQALAILLLALALAKPFIEVSQESLVTQSVLVIDTSASTRAFDGDRFDTIKERALEQLSNENIIILARKNPVYLEDGTDRTLSTSTAKDLIDDLEPTDVEGDLPTALDLAAQSIGPSSKVVIVSDLVLSSLESAELIEAKIRVLRSKGAMVEVIPIISEGKNIGIIDAALDGETAQAVFKIQNFNPEPVEFWLEANDNPVTLPANILAPAGKPGSLLSVNVPLGPGVNEITLGPDDDFLTDNSYTISLPEKDTVRVLLITNDKDIKTGKLYPALLAAGDQFTKIDVQIATPPKIPDLDHDLYIIKDVDPQFLLPGVIKELKERVEAGAIIVIFAQPGLFGMGLDDLLPVQYKEAEPLVGRQELLVNKSVGLLRGLSDIGQADGSLLLRTKLIETAASHAYIITNDGSEPVIAHKRLGKGAVIYYGIKDQKAVDIDPQSYAVIWGRIIDFSIPDLRLLNLGTGSIIQSSTKSVNTPSGKQPTPALALEQGLYQAGPTAIAANLYPLRMGSAVAEQVNVQYESTIGASAAIDDKDTASTTGEAEEVKVPKDLADILIFAGLAMLIIELLYIKYRGDL
jgi:hypothetical protein